MGFLVSPDHGLAATAKPTPAATPAVPASPVSLSCEYSLSFPSLISLFHRK